MSNHLDLIWLLLLLGGLVLPEIGVSAIELYAPSEVVAVNGTDVKLSCTFKSTHPVSHQSLRVAWSFIPLNSKDVTSVMYFHETSSPQDQGLFKDRAVWSGNVEKRDASITLLHVNDTFNGTYICHVTNLPDTQGKIGEIVLKVVKKVTVSEIGMLAAVVGGSSAVILVIVGIVMGVKLYKKRQKEMGIEVHSVVSTELY